MWRIKSGIKKKKNHEKEFGISQFELLSRSEIPCSEMERVNSFSADKTDDTKW